MNQHTVRDTPEVVVHGDRVRVDRVDSDLSHVEGKHRFGGIDLPAASGGTLAGLGTLVLAASALSALGAYGYQQGVRGADALSTAGLVAGLIALALTGLVAGWVAGRMSRYDGMRNGVLAAALLAVLTAGLGGLAAAAGDRFDLAEQAQLPTWVGSNATSGRALLTGLAGLALLLIAGALGGRIGAGWHRRADSAVAGTRAGGLAPYPTEAGR